MTESDEQSRLLANLAPTVTPGEYLLNKAKIAEAKALISVYEEMNEAGKQSHDDLARELEQRIREGEQARELLLQLKSQSTFHVPPVRRLPIEYPSSTSRIEEVSNYDSGSGHSQFQQFQGTGNQQTHTFMPQVTMQPVASSSSYQQSNIQQWIPENPNDGQSTQYSPYSQQPIMQNSSTSYTPISFSSPTPQQLPTGQDQGNRENRSRPLAPTQEQRRVPSHQDNTKTSYYRNSNFGQGQWRMYSPQTTIPVHAPGPSSQAAYKSGPSQTQQSSLTNTHSEATVSQSQATASGPTYSQGPLPRKTTNTAGQLATALGPQTQQPSLTNTYPEATVSQSQATVSGPTYSQGSLPRKTTNTAGQLATALGPQTQQSSLTNTHPEATVSQSQATASSPTYSQGLLPHKTTNTAGQLATAPGPQVNSSNIFPVPAATAYPNPILTNQIANDDRTSVLNKNATRGPHSLSHIPTTLPSIHMNYKQFIRELRETIKRWDAKAPPDSYFDHPSNYFRVHKDSKGTIRIIMYGKGQLQGHSQVVGVDQFCDWIQKRNTTTSVTPAVPAHLQTSLSSMSMPSNAPKNIPSTALKANVKATSSSSQSQSATPGASSSKRASSTISSSTHNQMIVDQMTTPSAPAQSRPSSASIPKTPIRQLTTMANGVPRSVKQADKKHLASHILFGLGKRKQLKETENSPEISNTPLSLQNASMVPLATSSTVTQVSSLPSPVPLARPVFVPPPVTQVSILPSPVPLAVPVPVPPPVTQVSTLPSPAPLARPVIVPPPVTQVPSPVPLARPVTVPPPVTQVSTLLSPVPLARPVIVPPPVIQVSTLPSPVPLARPVIVPPPVTQVSTLASPVPLTVPVFVSPLLESGKLMQPVASTIREQPQPLFLPSPVSSPGMDVDDDASISRKQSANVANRSRDLRKFSSSAKRKNRAFVLAPRRPPHLVKYFQLEKQKISRAFVKKGMASRGSVSKSVTGEEDFYNGTENLSPSYAEQQAVQLACSRLQELSCKWDGCSVKMNSVDALTRHLNRQHKPPTSHNNFFLCRWTQCGRRCNFHEKHLEKHASLPLNCPYEDCEKSFRSAPPLLKHTRAEHENDRLKSSTHLWYPTVNLPDAVLGVVPFYMIMTRGVNADEISSARHAILAPRVLRNISGLEREWSRNKARKTVRSNGDIISDEDNSNDYDFLNARPTRYSSQLSQAVYMQLEDLNSEDISRLVDEGLTLWGQEKMAVRTPSPDPLFREHRNEGGTQMTEA